MRNKIIFSAFLYEINIDNIMIQEFSVQNFLSIGSRQELSFVASSDTKERDILTAEVKPGLRLVRLNFFYGPNASGKSNILNAIDSLWWLQVLPAMSANAEIEYYHPFAMRKGEPTEMGIKFWANGRRFEYQVSYDANDILSERMMYTTDSGVLSLLYSRRKGEPIEFGGTAGIKAAERSFLQTNTLHNQTVLSSLTNKNVEVPVMSDLHKWIVNNVHDIGEFEDLDNIARQADSNEQLKNFIIDLLGRAGINISDFRLVDTPTLSIGPAKRAYMEVGVNGKALARSLLNKKTLFFTHNTRGSSFDLPAEKESDGTLMYFQLARLLYESINKEAICLHDEIEARLHDELLLHFLRLFLEHGGKTQMLCTTHNQSLLEQDWLMRRDMVWLTEKDRQTSETQVYRASSLGLHKSLSLANAYRIGKMGAQPWLGSTILGGE